MLTSLEPVVLLKQQAVKCSMTFCCETVATVFLSLAVFQDAKALFHALHSGFTLLQHKDEGMQAMLYPVKEFPVNFFFFFAVSFTVSFSNISLLCFATPPVMAIPGENVRVVNKCFFSCIYLLCA